MKFLFWLSLLFSSLSLAETLRGGNDTFSAFLSKGKDGKLHKYVKISRRNDKPEIIELSKNTNFSRTAADIAALNAYLNAGRALSVPVRFKSEKDLLYFISYKVRRIEASISDTLARTYISNVRQVASDLEVIVWKFDDSTPQISTIPRKSSPVHSPIKPRSKGSN
jgi:hypothetical protein